MNPSPRLRFLAISSSILLLVAGCASDPVITGLPQHWKGKPSADLKAALGEPTEVIPQSEGEVWIYRKTGSFVAAARDDTRFRAGGGSFGIAGNVTTTKQGERLSEYENIMRFLVRDGKVRKWSAARIIDGQTVWSDH
jgi:hypothetical protein